MPGHQPIIARREAAHMRISEVTDRTGIPARLLRYYEEQKLLVPARNASGYRDYSSQDVEVARRIRQLLDAGLSTATIRTVLPCLIERAGRLAPICDETVNDLKREQARIQASIETLAASRDAISSVIAAGRDEGGETSRDSRDDNSKTTRTPQPESPDDRPLKRAGQTQRPAGRSEATMHRWTAASPPRTRRATATPTSTS